MQLHGSGLRPLLRALWAFPFLLALAGAALGYTSASNPLDALASSSSLVVHGEVVAVESSWNEERTRITTRVLLRVEETIRQAVGTEKGMESVEIEVAGGRVGEQTLIVSGEAVFEDGEEVVVFLAPGPRAKFKVLDGDNGKLSVERSAKGPAWVRTWRGEAPLLMGGELERSATGQVLLSSLVEEVRALAGVHPGTVRIKAGGSLPPDQPGDIPPSATPSFHLTFPTAGVSTCPFQPSIFAHWALREEDDCDIEMQINPEIPAMASGAPTVQPIPAPDDIAAAIGEAIQAWNDVSPAVINLVVAGGDEPCPQTPTTDGINCIFWDPNYPADSTKPASSHSLLGGNGVMTEVDIQLNPRPHDMDDDTCVLTPLGWTTNPDCNQKFPLSVKVVVMHELGHLLGLNHPNETSPSNKSVCTRWDSGNQTLMHATYNNSCEVLHQADKDGLNFLYSADLGDAEDDPYPTLIHDDASRGPEHLFGIHTQADDPDLSAPRYQYEWLGIGEGVIDDNPAECEALVPDNDLDDGVEIRGECKDDGTLKPPVQVRIGVKTAADIVGQAHDYALGGKMYINGWFDWDDDGTFGSGEHVVGAGVRAVAVDKAGVYTFDLTAPDDTPCDVQSRFRLDWLEDVGQALVLHPSLSGPEGSAIFGEVEDYVGLTHDSGGGDPPPPPPPRYCHEAEIQVTADVTIHVKLDKPCHEPQGSPVTVPVPGQFPVGDSECFDTTATTGIDLDADGVVDEQVAFSGPACVTRSDPYLAADGLMTIDTEMTLFELSGFSPGLGPITLQAISTQAILGQIKQSEEALAAGVHLDAAHPADSSFTMFFEVVGDFGVSDPVGPLEVTAALATVPPVEPSDTIEPPPVRPVEVRPLKPVVGQPLKPGLVTPVGLEVGTDID